MTVLLFLLSCLVILLIPVENYNKSIIPLPTITVVKSFHIDSANIVGTSGITKRRRRQQPQPQPQHYHSQSRSYNDNAQQLQMCICIDCKFVTSCKAYHFVEQKHEQPHMTDTPTFLPREGSPTIQVNIRTEKVDEEDMIMWKDRIAQQQQAIDMEQQHQDYLAFNNNNTNNNRMNNSSRNAFATTTTSNTTTTTTTDSNSTNAIDNSTFVAVSPTQTKTKTTIEYDVVKCADFVLEKHCWMKNMPDEIKRVNPEFVPS